MKLRKVRGVLNPVDVLTKHMPRQEKLNQQVTLFGCAFVDGRAKSAFLLRKRWPDELVGTGFADEGIIEAGGLTTTAVFIFLKQEGMMLSVGRIVIPRMSSKNCSLL